MGENKMIKRTEEQQLNKIKRLENYYKEADEELEKFKQLNEFILKTLNSLVNERNICLENLLSACREYQVSSPKGTVTVVKCRTREFDGKLLYRLLTDKGETNLRDELIIPKFHVNSKVYDRAVADGIIEAELIQQVVKNVVTTARITEAPKRLEIE
jgi:hypothetical protein